MRADHEKNSGGVLTGLLLAAVVSLTGVVGAVKLVQTAANLDPGVGDVIAFDTKADMSDDMQSQAVVARDGEGECTLDLDTLHNTGGSLIVEGRAPGDPAAYQVHWAGKRSSPGPYDCGSSAELTLNDASLDLLAIAAGGWGPIHD